MVAFSSPPTFGTIGNLPLQLCRLVNSLENAHGLPLEHKTQHAGRKETHERSNSLYRLLLCIARRLRYHPGLCRALADSEVREVVQCSQAIACSTGQAQPARSYGISLDSKSTWFAATMARFATGPLPVLCQRRNVLWHYLVKEKGPWTGLPAMNFSGNPRRCDCRF